jgi:hypothetical protein
MRFEEFFGYANERESVRLRKEADFPFPWTEDKILQQYKFTNIRRENDRTSRAFIKTYREHAEDNPKDILLNCAINRYFGTEEFAKIHGWIPFEYFNPHELERSAADARTRGQRVFTGAYVITNGGISAPKEYVVAHHYIDQLWKALPVICDIADTTQSWQRVAEAMRKVDGFGGSGFMTKETLVDTTYTRFWDTHIDRNDTATMSIPRDWETWTPIGPGARRGITRILGDDDPDSPSAKKTQNNENFCMEMITTIMDKQKQFWKHEGGLYPHDIQFTLCEFDKYERVRLGQGRPRSTYKR